MNRRTVLKNLSAAAAAATLPAWEASADAGRQAPAGPQVRKIATEEAFTIPEIAEAFRGVVRQGGANLDLLLLKQIYEPASTPPTPMPADGNQTANRDRASKDMLPRLLDLEQARLADMDANGVDMHVLSLVMPGVQMFERRQAAELARLANDRLTEAVRRHPTRFAGLASVAPQDPQAAAKEMERATTTLKLNGFIINSHTGNAYLDDPRFFPLLEAAEALQAPLYIHPRAPSDGMAAPFRDYRLEGAVWGYGV